MNRQLFVAALAAAVLLPLAARADVPRSRPSSPADGTLVEYEVVLPEGTPASEVAFRLQAVAASAHGIATGVDAANRRATITLPKSQVDTLTKDRRLLSVKEAAPGASGRTIIHLKPIGNVVAPWSRSYSYDGAGNITAMGADTFVYDGVSRLTSATVNNNVQNFTYDGFGNRTAATALSGKCIHGTDCAVNRTIDANTNRITAGTSTDCGNSGNGGTCYDQAGNLSTLDTNRIFTWDALSVMQRRGDAGVTQEYIYDANDERIGTYAGGNWSWTIRDLGNRVLSEYTSSGTTGATGWTWQRDHIFRGGLLVASMTASGSTFHYHLDHLGTPRLITANGTEAAFHTYLPFGAELSTAPVESPKEVLRFTGHEFDDLGSIYSTFYMHARSASAPMGRFFSADPLRGSRRRPQTWNRYAYAGDNPVRFVDPTGLGFLEWLQWLFGKPDPKFRVYGEITVTSTPLPLSAADRAMMAFFQEVRQQEHAMVVSAANRDYASFTMQNAGFVTMPFMFMGGGGGEAVGPEGAEAALQDTTISEIELFRAVSPAEIESIVSSNGAFTPSPTDSYVKGFFYTQADAESFASMMGRAEGETYTVVATRAPADLVMSSPQHIAAGEGPGVYIPNEHLGLLSPARVPMP